MPKIDKDRLNISLSFTVTAMAGFGAGKLMLTGNSVADFTCAGILAFMTCGFATTGMKELRDVKNKNHPHP